MRLLSSPAEFVEFQASPIWMDMRRELAARLRAIRQNYSIIRPEELDALQAKEYSLLDMIALPEVLAEEAREELEDMQAEGEQDD